MDGKNIQFTRIELRIVLYLFAHYGRRYTARQLAGLLHSNHAHVTVLCKGLVSKRLLCAEQFSHATLYKFNYTDAVARDFVRYLLHIVPVPYHLRVVVHHLRTFCAHVTMGLIFGSSVSSSQYNDVDVLLVYTPQHKRAIDAIKRKLRHDVDARTPIRYVDMVLDDVIAQCDDAVVQAMLGSCVVFAGVDTYVEVVAGCQQ